MFDHLTTLAHDRSPARRAELLRSITDLFASAGHGVSSDVSEIYSDIVWHLVPGITMAERAEIALRLAELETAPHALIIALAQDEILLADPILRHSTVLSDEDLVRLSESLPRDHMVAIAGRSELSESVSDALIYNGDTTVLQAVARNPRARLSIAGLGRLVTEAGSDPALRRGLASRSGEPLGAMGELVPFPVHAPRSPRKVDPDQATGEVVVLKTAMADRSEAADAASRPVASVISAIASHDRMLEVAILLADHAGLPADLVSRMIAKTDSALLAILCKAAGIEDDTFALIADIRGRRFGQAPEAVAAAIEGYVGLPFAEAERALRFMRARHAEQVATTSLG